jgi:transposase
LLLKNYDALDVDGQKRLLELLECSDELKQTYWFKEWFRGWYHDRHYATAAYHLDDWLQAAKQSNIKEMVYVVKTITYWKLEILNIVLLLAFLRG